MQSFIFLALTNWKVSRGYDVTLNKKGHEKVFPTE